MVGKAQSEVPVDVTELALGPQAYTEAKAEDDRFLGYLTPQRPLYAMEGKEQEDRALWLGS